MAKKSKKRRPPAKRSSPARQAATKQAAAKQAATKTATKQAPAASAKRSADAPAKKAGTAPTQARSPRAKPTRAERIEEARRARRRKALLVRAAIVGVVLAAVAAVALKVVSDRREGDAIRRELTAGSCTFDTRADSTDPQGQNHIPNPRYTVDPPAGGNHEPQAAEAGTYRQENLPSDGKLVHALEHGYVILWHQPQLSDQERERLQGVADRFERDVLVVPRPSLRTKVAATAWEKRLMCRDLEPERLAKFTETYRNQGPEKVPH